MNNVTKMKVGKPAVEVFEAFVDPAKIGGFWFSSSSERWAPGKTVTLRYDEYNAEAVIYVAEVEANKKIVFKWGQAEDEHVVTIMLEELDHASTVVEVNEEGFQEDDIGNLIDNKEGWVYMLTCLKGYLEFGVDLRAALVK
ncbi:SRPBCC family protein [Brevibacillus sp. B_LB10_24]|uniref:SRPBCC family protein n=1 Tax=Brevibacillus sp. B_LB10_24 TaxID=3380645 RepID=UPI0038BDBA7A